MKSTPLIPTLLLLASACTTTSVIDSDLPFDAEASADVGKADHLEIEFSPILASISMDRRISGGTAILTSADSWLDYMGTEAPADVDFSTEWVAFYGIGVRNTGGHSAEILSLHNIPSVELLVMETSAMSPGPDCIVTQAITFPHAIVKFDIPATRPTRATAESHGDTYSCEIHGPCGDGTLPVCEILVPDCPEGLVRETVGGCFGECVNPTTCLPPPTEVCGDTVCSEGTECCNPLQGICVPPGFACAF